MQPHELLQDDWHNWCEAFDAASVDVRHANPMAKFVSLEPISIDDVERLYSVDEGENDGVPWLAYGKAQDGRVFLLSAWCDYTGWDCRSGGTITVASNSADLFSYGMTQDEIDRLAWS